MPYIGNSPGTGTRNRFIYTATASQTTFSGADDNGKTLKYSDSDYVDVYLNGICLVPVTDYTSTSKTSIVLTQAASLNDTLEVVAYDIATISDTVSKADGGQFDGAVTVEADFTVDSNTLHVDSANNKVGILDDAPDGALHVYNGMLQVGSKDGDTSIQQNANAIRIAAVPNSSTEWGGLQWYREFSNYIGAEIIAARASATESDTDLILKTSSTAANASERMRITHDGLVGMGRTPAAQLDIQGSSTTTLTGLRIRNSGQVANSAVSLIWSLNRDGSDVDFTAASITAHKQQNWTTSSSTVDSYITFTTVADETSSEKMRLDHNGTLFVTKTDFRGTLDTSDTNILGHNFYASGQHYMQRDGNATGNETMIINNIHSSGASLGIVQYRTQNTVEGSLNGSSSGLAISNVSDYRKKENVADATGCLDKINGLRPVTYTHRSEYDSDTTTVHTGFIAHEVSDHLPSIVNGTKDALETWQEGEELPDGVSVGDNKLDGEGNTIPKMQSLSYADHEMIANLVGAIKELKAENDAMRTRLDALEAG